jgi:zinc protease
MLAFFERWYAPANAILCVAGDVREEEFRRLVERHYGGVPAREVAPDPLRGRAPPPAAPHEPRLVTRDPAVREASFLRSWIAPTLTWGAENGRAYALEVLAHLLGGGQGSRMHKALVETGIAVGAGAGYDSDALGASTFSLFGTPRRDATPERLEGGADDVIRRLLDEGPTEAEVARSIRQMTAGALLALDSLGSAPRMIGSTLAVGLPIEAVEFWPARLRAVTPADVADAARAVLGGAGARTTGWLLPGGDA